VHSKSSVPLLLLFYRSRTYWDDEVDAIDLNVSNSYDQESRIDMILCQDYFDDDVVVVVVQDSSMLSMPRHVSDLMRKTKN
jgi:hypothetical protein